MDPTNIEHLVKLFARTDVGLALAALREAIQVCGDLDLGDEGLTIYRGADSELVSFSFRIELDDSRSEFDVLLTDEQQAAAELLWSLGLKNARRAEREAQSTLEFLEFIAAQADRTATQLGLRLNEDDANQLSIYPGPLPKP
jgi:hypothetical protein